MKKNESRFFLNWQLPKEDATALHHAASDQERSHALEQWLHARSGLATATTTNTPTEAQWAVILSFFEGNYDAARRGKFTQQKMAAFLEIMLYLLKQLLADRLPEDKSFAMFKELLLRHSVQRPPHSLAIFTLDDVKVINDHVQDSFFRFYNMYLYALTKDQLIILNTEQ